MGRGRTGLLSPSRSWRTDQTEVDKAKIKRARYQDQEVEGLTTREELGARLVGLFVVAKS